LKNSFGLTKVQALRTDEFRLQAQNRDRVHFEEAVEDYKDDQEAAGNVVAINSCAFSSSFVSSLSSS
jgi:hypothetical protein